MPSLLPLSIVAPRPNRLRRSQLEQDFEIASNEYDYINTAMKNELPRFLVQAAQFIDPLFHSFYYMQCAPVPLVTRVHQ